MPSSITIARINIENFLFPAEKQSTGQIIAKTTIIIPIFAALAYCFLRGLEYLGLGNRDIKQVQPNDSKEIEKIDVTTATILQSQEQAAKQPAQPVTQSNSSPLINSSQRKPIVSTQQSSQNILTDIDAKRPNPVPSVTGEPNTAILVSPQIHVSQKTVILSTQPPSQSNKELQPSTPAPGVLKVNEITFQKSKSKDNLYEGSNGDTYEGMIKDGKMDDPKGIYTFHQGWKIQAKFKGGSCYTIASLERDGKNAKPTARITAIQFNDAFYFNAFIKELEDLLPSNSVVFKPVKQEVTLSTTTHTQKSYKFANGTIYEGELLNGEPAPNCRGCVLIYPNGVKVEGANREGGEFTIRGESTVTFPNGDIFRGQLSTLNSLTCSLSTGTMRYANGDIYRGGFESGGTLGDQKFNLIGKRIYSSADGVTIKTAYLVNEISPDIQCGYCDIKWVEHIEDMSILNSPITELHAYIRRKYNDNLKYKGNTLSFLDGSHFEGTFDSKGQMLNGTLIQPYVHTTEKYEGQFENGWKVFGKQTFYDGSIYEGAFKEGKMDSGGHEATYTFPDGYTYTGTFKNGKFEQGLFANPEKTKSIRVTATAATDGNIVQLAEHNISGRTLRQQMSST